MGFWKQLFGTEKIPYQPKLEAPARSAPPMPTIKEPKKDISEPVLSIIQTLKDGEWSYIARLSTCATYLEFLHEWFGNKLNVRAWTYDKLEVSCRCEWMTQDEKEAVGSICWQIYQGRVKWEKEQSLAKQRESFMNLVKEPNETN